MGKLHSIQRGEAAAQLPMLAAGTIMSTRGENENAIVARSRVPLDPALLPLLLPGSSSLSYFIRSVLAVPVENPVNIFMSVARFSSQSFAEHIAAHRDMLSPKVLGCNIAFPGLTNA